MVVEEQVIQLRCLRITNRFELFSVQMALGLRNDFAISK